MMESQDKTLENLVAACTVDTGLTDLASRHDKYLYGKKGELTEAEIDIIVVSQIDDDNAWEDPIEIGKP